MKKLLLLLCLSLVTASLFAQTNAHMYLSNGMHQHWDMASIDSITYLRPTSEIILPEACTLQAGKSQAAAYWADSQYRNFSEFIDGVCMTIVQALKRFEEEKEGIRRRF